MKKIITICAAFLMTVSVFAQAPEKISYHAVVRDGSNALVTSTAVGMQISILQGSASGTAVYVETHTPTSNANGLVIVEIGGGSVVSGTFATIDWANDSHFIKTETDPTGGTSYTITGTSQLLGVPYALHAKTADTLTGTITETDPVYGASVAAGITGADTTKWNNKWGVTGNTGTTVGTNFLGTTDAQDFAISTNNTERIRVQSGGNVGIGTTGPKSALHVHVLDAAGTGGGAPIILSRFDDGTNFRGSAITHHYTTTDVLGFAVRATGSTAPTAEADLQMVLTGTGDVGIGTTSPGAKLEVAGQVKITGGTPGAGKVLTSDASGLATWTSPTLTPTLTIGQSYQGGIIFWLDATGQHGLIAATADQSSGIQWYNGSYIVTNAVRDGIGAGMYNTERIIANQGTGSYAAQLCANYQGGGYGDWYLPSKYELNLLYLQKDVVGGFATWYWSSTETDANDAWGQFFPDGFQTSVPDKGLNYYVRAVRAF